MGYWIIRHGTIVWDTGTVDPDTDVDTGQRKWWSSWAPSMWGLFNAELPVYVRASWTQRELAATVNKIRQEVSAHDDRWAIQYKQLGNDGLSTCRAKDGDGNKHQSQRRYDLIVNKSNPLGYQLRGVSDEQLIDIGTVHEQTHALCDLSYTANNKNSRLATWNDDDGAFSESSEAAGAQRKRLETLWERSDDDPYLSQELKQIMHARFGYGYGNLIDIDTVVTELCLLVSFSDVSLLSPTIRGLIDFAELNLGYRAIGRRMQEEVPKLRRL